MQVLKRTGRVSDDRGVITVTELDTLSLVPPGRFGRLLAEHRWGLGASLEVLVARTRGRFDTAQLADIEAGRRLLTDDDLALLSAVYGVHAEADVQPRRTRLVVDLDEGFVASGSQRRVLGPGDSVDDILTRYLGLILALRGEPAGSPTPLRQDDLAVLTDTLWIEPEEVEARLAVLMTNPRDRVGRRVRRLSRRTVVPEAGILVALTGEGLLVLDSNGENPDGEIGVVADFAGADIIALARRDSPTAGAYAARSA